MIFNINSTRGQTRFLSAGNLLVDNKFNTLILCFIR